MNIAGIVRENGVIVEEGHVYDDDFDFDDDGVDVDDDGGFWERDLLAEQQDRREQGQPNINSSLEMIMTFPRETAEEHLTTARQAIHNIFGNNVTASVVDGLNENQEIMYVAFVPQFSLEGAMEGLASLRAIEGLPAEVMRCFQQVRLEWNDIERNRELWNPFNA